MEHDPEVQKLVRAWRAPDAPPGMDDRMMARYRALRGPIWRRRFEVRLSIPAPALAAVLLVVACAVGWIGYVSRSAANVETAGGFQPVSAPVLTVTRAGQ